MLESRHVVSPEASILDWRTIFYPVNRAPSSSEPNAEYSAAPCPYACVFTLRSLPRRSEHETAAGVAWMSLLEGLCVESLRTPRCLDASTPQAAHDTAQMTSR